MSVKTAPLALRLFMEGVEVPVISAQISIAPGQPAVASVQVIPTDAGLNLLPRTLVHLFVLEDIVNQKIAAKFRGAPSTQATPGLGGAPAQQQRNRLGFQDRAYILVFCGEVIGLAYSKNPTARSLVLQCMDLSSYWDTCYQWFADYSVTGNALTDKIHAFVGSKEGLFDNITKGHKWVVGQLLNSKPRSPAYANTQGLLGGLIHLLEAVGGVRPHKSGAAYMGGYKGVTDFFTIAESRYNLMGQIGAVEADTTSANIYSGKSFIDWMRNGMGSMGSLLSFRDILRQVGQWIFHDVYPNPAPYLVDRGQRNVTVSTSRWSDTPSGKSVISSVDTVYQNFENAKVTMSSLQSQSNLSGAESANAKFQSAFTTMLLSKSELKRAEKQAASIGTDDVSTLKASMSSAVAATEKAVKLVTSVSGTGQELSKSGDIVKAIDDVLSSLDSLLDTASAPLRKKKVAVTNSTHLYSQLILPETYFMAPPQCNVMFPDQIYSLSYSRNFAREITRLSMSAGTFIAGQQVGTGLGGHLYFAPLIKDLAGKTLVSTKSGARILLPHELHSGIIPKVSWATGGHKWGTKAAKIRQAVDRFYPKFGYLERLAHFQFYQERWAARQLSIESVYDPYLVIGLPGLIIDKPILDDAATKQIESVLGRQYLPTQFLGKVAALTHHISQDGGRTMTTMTHARTHRGRDDEFLGALLQEEVEPTTKKLIIPLYPLFKNPRFGGASRENLLGAVNLYLTSQLIPNKTDYQAGQKIVAVTPDTRTFILTKAMANAAGLDEGVIPAGQDSRAVPSTLKLTLRFFEKSGKTRQMPIEEALMPGWYDAAWSKQNIGDKVYLPLLGTGSIYDDNVRSRVTSVPEAAVPENVDTRGELVTDGGETELVTDLLYATDEGVVAYAFSVPNPPLEVAIDTLATIYGKLKSEGLDVHQFIYDYIRRPIADMEDILGTQDLEFGPTGEPLTGDMREGFHSRAFGDYNADRKVDPNTGQAVAGTKALLGLYKDVQYDHILEQGRRPPNEKVVDPFLDPRGAARARVTEYMRELNISRGLRGL